jgi:hypothetical protein
MSSLSRGPLLTGFTVASSILFTVERDFDPWLLHTVGGDGKDAALGKLDTGRTSRLIFTNVSAWLPLRRRREKLKYSKPNQLTVTLSKGIGVYSLCIRRGYTEFVDPVIWIVANLDSYFTIHMYK